MSANESAGGTAGKARPAGPAAARTKKAATGASRAAQSSATTTAAGHAALNGRISYSSRLGPAERTAAIERLKSAELDVLVVGGGIVGVGCAMDAATRGLNVGLVEMRDFASGTSSRSSKLVHGGIRYLEQLDFRLVLSLIHISEPTRPY